MGSVKRLADEVARGLREVHPRLRKTVVNKLALAVGAMIEGQTPNTVELANLLPLDTERQDLREQWLRRLLKNPRLGPGMVIEPFARAELAKAASHGQTVLLSLDQTDLGDRMALLMVALRVGDRAIPLAWRAEEGAANLGFAGQQVVLEPLLAWAAVRGARAAIGGPVLSVGGPVRVAPSPGLELPAAPEEQRANGYRAGR
ncbi:hypothetical protein [Thiocystis violascens]|uniref:hypothetical protein n=1 Tax=Thiocystis violascens TaxID=73141 RepID=UPI001FDF996A|nr:hypothetical protein [Thiocystis violascens]